MIVPNILKALKSKVVVLLLLSVIISIYLGDLTSSGYLMAGEAPHNEAGKYGFQFLQIPVNPVSIAMAGRAVHAKSNPMAWVFQPAAGVLDEGRSISASHTFWLDDTSYTNLAYSNSSRKYHLGLVLRNLDYGQIENRDETGYLIGTYNPIDLNLSGNLAFRITPDHYAGINLGAIYEKLNTVSALGITSDLGYTYLPPILDSKVSIGVRNLGYSGKMDKERPKLPVSYELDISKGIAFDERHLLIELGAQKAVDTDLRATLGTELVLFEMLALRAGYKYNFDAEDLTAGLGFKFAGFCLDYSWAAFSKRLNDVHSIGLTYSF